MFPFHTTNYASLLSLLMNLIKPWINHLWENHFRKLDTLTIIITTVFGRLFFKHNTCKNFTYIFAFWKDWYALCTWKSFYFYTYFQTFNIFCFDREYITLKIFRRLFYILQGFPETILTFIKYGLRGIISGIKFFFFKLKKLNILPLIESTQIRPPKT